jgi:methyltransferase (TIGR00027 family)
MASHFSTLAKNDVAKTALFVAAVRARETKRSDPLFRDELSALLAGPEGLEWLAAAEADPRSNYHRDSFPYLEVRTRFFDDWALASVEKSKSRQLVILGAGMDTRAFRLKWPRSMRIWELDSPELFSLKEGRLRSRRLSLDVDRITVSADLTSKGWVAQLVKKGFEKETPTVWLAEGLFQYLSASDVAQILTSASSVSCGGSRFGAEIITEDYLRSVRNQSALLRRTARGAPWVFGTNDPESLFLSHGWHVDQKVGALEAAKAMKRWPASPATRVRPPGSFFIGSSKTSG